MKNLYIFLISSLILFNIQLVESKIPFKRGINLTGWYMSTNAGEIQFSKYTQKDFENIKSLGCDVIRLPIDFYSMNSGSPDYIIDPLLLTYIDQTVTLAENKQLYLILDIQPENSELACQNPKLESLLTKVWEQLATRYNNRSTFVIYEILNEPNTFSTSVWGQIQQNVINAIRSIDTKHKIIVSASYWSTTLELNSLPVYKDTNLIYTFHFYEPGIFTHQGITWYVPSLGSVQNVPFPYNAATMPPLPSGIIGTYWEDEFKNYKNTGTLEKVKSKLAQAITFKKKRNIDMYCGEFGAYNEYTPADSRNFYYREIRKYLEANDIPWTSWDYSYGFGLFLPFSKARFDYDLNIPMLAALGLKIPAEVDPKTKPDSVGFNIYTDSIGAKIVESSDSNDGTINLYSTEKPNNEKYCIFWTGSSQYGSIGFNFVPDKDLSSLVTNGYALSFLVRGNTPNTKIDLSFINSKTENASSHPWCINYTLDESMSKWDGKWHKVFIPLNQFTEIGARENNIWYNPVGAFDWKTIDRLEIVSRQGSLENKAFWFDNILISNMDTAHIYESGIFEIPPDLIEINRDSTDFKIYPNPVSLSATIIYKLIEKEHVDISIFNLSGLKIKSVLNTNQPAGKYFATWNTDDDSGHKVHGGVYICRILISSKVNGFKMVVINN